MSTVLTGLSSYSSYRDSRSQSTQSDQRGDSSTVYVGNLSFFTTEEQIYCLFNKIGPVKRIIMGLDRVQKTPCGFCFVEYFHHLDALNSLRYISSTKLDERIIRADLDPGYLDNRQYGRGKSGGQVRDEYRDDFDAGRGGWGHLKSQQEIETQRQQEQNELYSNQNNDEVPSGNHADSQNPGFRGERDD